MPSRGPTACPVHSIPCKGTIDHDHRELYIQICKPGPDGAVHWLIFMKCPGATRGIRLHSTGYKGNRRLSIEPDKRFNSWQVEDTHYLGIIPADDRIIVPKEAEKIPLQSCQLWACYLMLRLERKGLLRKGTFDHYMHCYKHKFLEDYGPGDGIFHGR